MRPRHSRLTAFALLAVWTASDSAAAQIPNDFRSLEGIGPAPATSTTETDLLKVSGYFTPPQAGRSTLYVTAALAPGWHTYSLTQKSGGPVKSKINLTASVDYKLADQFKPLQPPQTHEYAEIWPDLPVEEHHGRVTWSAPIEIAPAVDPATLEIAGALYAQVCAKECLPPQDYKFVARLGKDPRTATGPVLRRASKTTLPGDAPFGQSGSPNPSKPLLALSGRLDSAVVQPGGSTRLVVSAQPEPGWHVYPLAATDPKEVSKPTLIVPEPSPPLVFGQPIAQSRPLEKPSTIIPGGVERYYDGPVSWEIPVSAPRDARPGSYKVEGLIGYQTCKEDLCDAPRAVRFEARLVVGAAGIARTEPLRFSEAKYGEAAAAAERLAGQPQSLPASSSGDPPNESAATTPPGPAEFDETLLAQNVRNDSSWIVILLSAFFGGMILNLMPCVFPVIGLKVLSFVEQSHHDRARLLVLNLWYSLGVIVVFLALAAIAIILRSFVGVDFKYGSQNAIQGYAIGMAAVMFVMGLSLLGLWEIPIPGFLGSGKAGQIVQQEGPTGAVAKGAITTLLGASCSGPLVAVPFAFALDRGTPAWATLGTFAVIGLGMASPYLVLGANPRLLRFLPKPGPWMDTFKHVCGFVLLAATVWVLSFIKLSYVTPTVAFLLGLGAACWWIGRVPHTQPADKRLRAWGWAVAISVAAGVFAFGWFAPAMTGNTDAEATQEFADGSRLPWQPFSKELLKKLTRDHKTVMVDFTADWCLNCKALEKAVLNTAEVKSVVHRNGVVPLVADYTDAPPELTEMMTLLKAGAVPVLAIFPAGDPNNPTVFRGGYTKQTLIDALEQAGPSDSIAVAKESTIK